ncbi:MAG TPA: hypothetical protein VHZ03_15815 [Trebonia sp.]|nr:hypothetical protein [Trebonia sp.]
MSGAPLLYTPPAYAATNVLYGIGVLFTAPVGTAVPSDQNLGVGSSWVSGGWNYIGATDQGVSLTFNPTTTDIRIEEQQTPVAALVDQVTMEITTSLSEETLANISLAWGNSGSVSVTAPGASQPGKTTLVLSTNFNSLACALVGKNQLGFARVLSVPVVMSAGSVKTDYRRAANNRSYPLTLNAISPMNEITITDLTALASS